MTALQFLSNQSLDSLLTTFWILAYVEVPRFFVGAVVLAWFLLFRKNAAHPESDGPAAYQNGISIVVAGHNAAHAIQRTLASLHCASKRHTRFKSSSSMTAPPMRATGSAGDWRNWGSSIPTFP